MAPRVASAAPEMMRKTCDLEAATVAEPVTVLPRPSVAAEPRRAVSPPEMVVLGEVQRRLGRPPLVWCARAMSIFGEHAVGWLAAGGVGAVLDGDRRREWIRASVAVAAAHLASIVLKRIVRRPRPDDPSVAVLAGTPSRLSFPSSHASSTTAAAVLFGGLLGRRLTGVLVPPMMLSRLLLGVHYPSDVLAGSALGAVVAVLARRLRLAPRSAREDARR